MSDISGNGNYASVNEVVKDSTIDGQNGTLDEGGANSSHVPKYIRLNALIQGLFTHNTETADAMLLKNSPKITLTDLANAKAKFRKKLIDCKAAQQECNFELTVSVLTPRKLKPISCQEMKKLIAKTIPVISACESEFVLLSSQDDAGSEDLESQGTSGAKGKNNTSASHGVPTVPGLSEEDSKQRKFGTIIDQNKAKLESTSTFAVYFFPNNHSLLVA